MKKILFVAGVTGWMLLTSACEKAKSCEQAVEGRARVVNLTLQTQNVEFVVRAYQESGEGSENQTTGLTFGPNSSTEVVFYKTARKRSPVSEGKLDFDPQDATCNETAEFEKPQVKLSEASAMLVKLCVSSVDEQVFLIELGGSCPVPIKEDNF